MNTAIIIQARMSSTRLPGKILLPLNSKSVLGHVIERCKKTGFRVIVATTTELDDEKTAEEAKKYGAEIFRGDLNDVQARYVGAIEKFKPEIVVRITSDCPCIDPNVIVSVVELLKSSGADYAANIITRSFPHGLDTEAFLASALLKNNAEEKRPEMREHVTAGILRSDEYKKVNYAASIHGEKIRCTLDTPEDYTALLAIFDILGEDFSCSDLISLYEKHPWLHRINSSVYQKAVFLNATEELKEAKKLLTLHNMQNAAKIICDKL